MKHLTITTVLGMGFFVGFMNSVLSTHGSTPQPYPTITYEGQSSDTFQGTLIKWFKGRYRDLDVAGLNPKDLNKEYYCFFVHGLPCKLKTPMGCICEC
ncbi:hypothetical protein ACFL3F_03435 [Planctomycetota bacterium]